MHSPVGVLSSSSVFISTFAGGISNSGAISAASNGIFVGGTAVANGHLTIETFLGGISNTGTITAAGNGILVGGFASSASSITVSTFSGGISNSGTISAAGHGIFVGGISTAGSSLTISTFSGGISNSGTISSRSGVGLYVLNVATFLGGITNSGTISTSAADAGIVLGATQFFGNLSNSGTISGAHTGIFVCSCASFADGGITNTGTISAHNGILVLSGAPVSVFDSGTIVSTGTGAKAIDISGAAAGSSLTLGPGYNITGFVFGQNGDALQLGGSGSGTFNLSNVSDVIAGGSSSALPQYQGFNIFNVVSGTWTLTGTFSGTESWNVNGGVLAGTGTFAGINVNTGGILSPGLIGTPGTSMTVGGKLTFQAGTQYLVFLNPSTASFANVSGTALLNGTVDAVFAPGSYIAKQYTILQSTGLDGTTFASLNNSNLPPGFTDSLSYSANDVFLNLTAALGVGTPLNQNQQNVANALNSFFNNGGALPPGFAGIFNLTGTNLANALTQLDGENATGAEHSAFELMNEFLGLMLDPYVDGRIGGSAGGPLGFAPDQEASFPPDIALAYAGVFKAPPKQTFAQRWSTWASGFGGSATTNGDATVGSNDMRTGTFGYAAGMDYHYSPDTVLGFALAGGGTSWNLVHGLGTGRSDALLAGVYGVTHQGPAYIAGALAFANNWFTTNRTALSDQLAASFQGQSYAARLESGYRFAVPVAHNAVGITPYAAVQAQNFHTPSYRETDLTAGGFGLSYAAMNGTDTRSEVGSRFDDLTAISAMPLILRGRLAWAHDWVGNPALNASFESLPGTSFIVFGAPIPYDSALTSAGAQLFFTPNWSLLAQFDGEFAKGSQSYDGSGTLHYTW